MIYSIVAIGDPILKTKAKNLASNLAATEMQQLIADMFETMYESSGVGLAAPQIGQSVRLFVVDGEPFNDDEDEADKAPLHPERPRRLHASPPHPGPNATPPVMVGIAPT